MFGYLVKAGSGCEVPYGPKPETHGRARGLWEDLLTSKGGTVSCMGAESTILQGFAGRRACHADVCITYSGANYADIYRLTKHIYINLHTVCVYIYVNTRTHTLT